MSKESFAIVICPNHDCGQKLRVPRGKGTLNVTCPRCRRSFHFFDGKPTEIFFPDAATDALIDRLSTMDSLWLMLCELGVCQQCNRKVPAGVHPCPHCHGRSLAVTDTVLQIMNAARRLVDKSVLLYQAGDMEGSKRMLHEALRFNPYNPMAHNNMGGMLIHEGQYEVGTEYLERAVLLDPSLDTASEFLRLGLRALEEELPYLRCYGLEGWFAFDSEHMVSEAFEALPLELRQRLKHSIWKVIENVNIARQAICRRLQPLWGEALEGWARKFLLEVSGDPLTKAEIWYIVMSMRSGGMRDSKLAMVRMLSTEADRLNMFFGDKSRNAVTSSSTLPEIDQQNRESRHTCLIVIGSGAHLFREELLTRAPDLWDSVYAAPTVEAANGFFRRGKWQYMLRYVVDMPAATVGEKESIALKIFARLQSLLSGGNFTEKAMIHVQSDGPRLSLTATTIPVDGRRVRSIAKEIENAFLGEINSTRQIHK
jgi:tetratricopeptide (TPR) repeat protein